MSACDIGYIVITATALIAIAVWGSAGYRIGYDRALKDVEKRTDRR